MKFLFQESNSIKVGSVQRLKYAENIDKYSESVELGHSIVLFLTVQPGDQSIFSDSLLDKIIKPIFEVMDKEGIKDFLLFPWVHGTAEEIHPSSAYQIYSQVKEVISRKVSEANLEFHSVGFGVKKTCSDETTPNGLCLYYDLEKEYRSKRESETQHYSISEFRLLNSELCDSYSCNVLIRSLFKKYVDDSSIELKAVSLTEGNDMPNEILSRYELIKPFQFNEFRSYEDSNISNAEEYYTKNHLGDVGNIFWKPKGAKLVRLVSEILRKWIRLNLFVHEVDGPTMLDTSYDTIKIYLNKFPSKTYDVRNGKKKFALRYAACPSHFNYVKNSYLTKSVMPLRIFEMAKSVYRLEKSGETKGIQRLRSFTMPDMHIFTSSVEENKIEFLESLKHVKSALGEYNLFVDCVPTFRCTRNFFESNQLFLSQAVELIGGHAIFELWNQQKYYFELKFEMNSIINGFESQLSTVQIDNMYPKLYALRGVDSTGKFDVHAMHVALIGSIERVVDALLRKGLNSQFKLPRLIVLTEGKPGKKLTKLIMDLSLKIPIELDEKPAKINNRFFSHMLAGESVLMVDANDMMKIEESDVQTEYKLKIFDAGSANNQDIQYLNYSEILAKINSIFELILGDLVFRRKNLI